VRRAGVALVLAAFALLLGGCGSSHRPRQLIRGTTLTIYLGGPSIGASSVGAQAVANAARMALDQIHGRIGRYRIALRTLDDATIARRGWDPNQTTINARLAVQDPTTIGYLGDFNSGASAIAIPVLNQAGIPEVSAWSSAVGLTFAGPGYDPGEPQKYYPTGIRTFARVVPSDAIQALALVQLQKSVGCSTVFVVQDGEVDGEDAAISFLLTAKSRGLRVVGTQAFSRGAASYVSLASAVASSGADCVLVSAIDEHSAALLTEQVASAVPKAMIFATNGLADSAYTSPPHGIPLSLDSRVLVASPMLDAAAYPSSARVFLAAYTREFGSPQPSALFGYEAMRLMLAAIAKATDNGRRTADRVKVLDAIIPSERDRGVLGTYGIDRDGDTTIDRYGIYRIVGGQLSFVETAG
jgi:branched-chain amino acid transport system substrate-binding protein